MRRVCGVCATAVPSGCDECPGCGADARSFSAVFLVLSCGGERYRVGACPFEGTRGWARAHFRGVEDGEGAPAYRYMRPDAPMFRVESAGDGYVFSSAVVATPEVNHWRLDDRPLDATGAPLSGERARLELWSGRRRRVVMSLEVALEVAR